MSYRDWLLDQQDSSNTYAVHHALPSLMSVMSNTGPVLKVWLVLMLVNFAVLSVIL